MYLQIGRCDIELQGHVSAPVRWFIIAVHAPLPSGLIQCEQRRLCLLREDPFSLLCGLSQEFPLSCSQIYNIAYKNWSFEDCICFTAWVQFTGDSGEGRSWIKRKDSHGSFPMTIITVYKTTLKSFVYTEVTENCSALLQTLFFFF